MGKDVRSLILVLGLPFAAAALLLGAGVAWRSLQPAPAFADGAGVDNRNGYALTTVDVGGGVQYLCMTTTAPYANDGQMRQFLTVYELKRTGEGRADLFFVGSRCIEFDRGFSEINFKSPSGYKPTELERALKSAQKNGAGNEPPSN